MTDRRMVERALEGLLKQDLQDLIVGFEIGVSPRASKTDLAQALAEVDPFTLFSAIRRDCLRDVLARVDLDPSGRKPELVDRIVAWCGRDAALGPSPGDDDLDAAQVRLADLFARELGKPLLREITVDRLGDDEVRPNWAAERIARVLVLYDDDDLYDELRTDELRRLVGAIGLSTLGSKDDLFARLLAWAEDEPERVAWKPSRAVPPPRVQPERRDDANTDEDCNGAADYEDVLFADENGDGYGPLPMADPPPPATAPVALPPTPVALPLAATAVPQRPPGAGGQRLRAVLIGNQSYKRLDALHNPAKDVRDLAEMLTRLGHEASAHIDLDLRGMKQVLRDVKNDLTSADDGVLFYFAGHGRENSGNNYLLPVDFFPDSTPDHELQDEAMHVERILKMFRRQRFRVCILDTCRHNAWQAGDDPRASVLPEPDGTEGTLICYATAPGKDAEDGTPGTNGTYTAALLECLPVPGRKIEDVLKEVRRRVSHATGGEQIPWELSSLMGDWYPAGP